MTGSRILKQALLAGPIALVALLGGCLPTEDGSTDIASSIWPMLIFIVFLFGLMYFMMIRPQRKRQKEHRQLIEQLHKGDKVITAGGIYGRVESADDVSVVLKVESGATMRIARTSVIGLQSEPETETG